MSEPTPGEEEREVYGGIWVVLPPRKLDGEYGCARDWCDQEPSYCCGCPECLRVNDQTLIYLASDFDEDIPQEMWRRRVVALEVARYRPDLVVPGYPKWP